MIDWNQILSLFVQVPLVGIFVVFVIYWSREMARSQADRDEQMRNFFSEQRKADRDLMADLCASVKSLAEQFGKHDSKMAKAIAKMEERTRSKPKEEEP